MLFRSSPDQIRRTSSIRVWASPCKPLVRGEGNHPASQCQRRRRVLKVSPGWAAGGSSGYCFRNGTIENVPPHPRPQEIEGKDAEQHGKAREEEPRVRPGPARQAPEHSSIPGLAGYRFFVGAHRTSNSSRICWRCQVSRYQPGWAIKSSCLPMASTLPSRLKTTMRSARRTDDKR